MTEAEQSKPGTGPTTDNDTEVKAGGVWRCVCERYWTLYLDTHNYRFTQVKSSEKCKRLRVQ